MMFSKNDQINCLAAIIAGIKSCSEKCQKNISRREQTEIWSFSLFSKQPHIFTKTISHPKIINMGFRYTVISIDKTQTIYHKHRLWNMFRKKEKNIRKYFPIFLLLTFRSFLYRFFLCCHQLIIVVCSVYKPYWINYGLSSSFFREQ